MTSPTDDKRLNLRAFGLLAAIAMAFSLIGLRFWDLQVVHGAYYRSLGRQDYLRRLPIPAPRGQIVTSDGVAVATYRPAWALYYLGQGRPLPSAEASRLAAYLGTTAASLNQTVAQMSKLQPSYQPIQLDAQLTPQQMTVLEENRQSLPNIRIQPVAIRYYPYGNLMGSVLGYVGYITPAEWPTYQKWGYAPDAIVGQAGLEQQYERYLQGQQGGEYAEVTRTGRLVKLIGQSVPTPGDTLHLTINWRLEKTAQDALAYVMHTMQTSPLAGSHSAGATQGAVIAIDPQNGNILAMASLPTYNPEKLVPGTPGRGHYFTQLLTIPGVLTNLVLNYALPPGSIFKPIVAVAALASHVVTASTTIFDPGYFPAIPTFHNWYPYGFGTLNIEQAIGLSDDTFFYTLGYDMGIQTMDKWFERFLLNKPSGVDLPGGNQTPDVVPSPATLKALTGYPWTTGWNLNTAIGQGIDQFTLIDLARADSAIANGGTLYRPHLVSAITTPTGKVVKRFPPQVQGKLNVPAGVLHVVHLGMEMSAQDPNIARGISGTGYGAMAGFPLPVATKTGTAQLAPGKPDNALFLTFAPAHHPTILVIVYIKAGLWGAHSGFVARAIYDQYFKVADPTAKALYDSTFGGNYAWPFGYGNASSSAGSPPG